MRTLLSQDWSSPNFARWVTIRSFELLVLSVVLLRGCVALSTADDWTQWRGPERSGCSAETGLLQEWPESGPSISLQISGVGSGYAGVVVADGRILTIGRHETVVIACALDARTGDFIWKHNIGDTTRNPSSTPVVDAERVYVLDPDGDLYCLSTKDGQPLWHVSLADDFHGQMMSARGYGESPLIDGDRLICTPGGSEFGMVALNKYDGRLVWKTSLPVGGEQGKDGAAFSSVVVSEAAGVRQYVQLVGRGLIGVDAADGRVLWHYNAIANTNANIPTPLTMDDRVFSANGYTAGSVLLRLSKSDPPPVEPDTPVGVRADVEYTLKGSQFQNHHGGVVRAGEYLYGGHGNNNGLPTCIELNTGKIRWKRRGPGTGSAAVIYADGCLYFRYQDGLVALIRADPEEYRLSGTLQIPNTGGDSWSHPAISDGRLYLREQNIIRAHDILAAGNAASKTRTNGDEPTGTSSGDEVVAGFQSSGVAVETFPGGLIAAKPASDNRSQLALALRDEYDTHDENTVLVLGYSDRHLDQAGLLKSDMLEQIRDSGRRVELRFSGTRISDDGVRALSDLPVVGLDLELCTAVSDACLENVAGWKQLRLLNLSGTRVTSAGIRHLADSHVTVLELSLCDEITDESCPEISGIRRLRSLNLKKSGFESNRVGDTGLQALKNLADLEVLNLYGNSLTDDGLQHLEAFGRLRVLDLSLLPLTDRGLSYLSSLLTIEDLNLLYAEGFAGPKVTGEGLTSLAKLSELRALNLTGARLTDEDLASLAGLNNLQSLWLVRSGVSEAAATAFQVMNPECRISR